MSWRRVAVLTIAVAAATWAALAPARADAQVFYVANATSGSVSSFNGMTHQLVGPPITVGREPGDIAISPDGTTAYVPNFNGSSIGVIDTQTNQMTGLIPLGVNEGPREVEVSPDGKTLYVSEFYADDVAVIDAQSQTIIRKIPVGDGPAGIALTPDGRTLYVADALHIGDPSSIAVVDTQTGELSSIPDAEEPIAVALSPDGGTVYAANALSNDVAIIDTRTKQVTAVVPVGQAPVDVALTPDGKRLYVPNLHSESVSVLDTVTKGVIGSIHVGIEPINAAISPDGKTVLVANRKSNNVSVIAAQTNELAGPPIPTGLGPDAVAFGRVNLFATASLSAPRRVRLGAPVRLDASASTDPDGVIASFAWSFGDGSKQDGAAAVRHLYRRPGTYRVGVTVTDNEGCSVAPVPGGPTMPPCHGSSEASRQQAIRVLLPSVRVTCPRSVKARSCRVTLQGLTRKSKGNPETSVATARIKSGKTALVPLKPRPRFIKKLGLAKVVLVKEVLAAGKSKRTTFRRLLIRLPGAKSVGRDKK